MILIRYLRLTYCHVKEGFEFTEPFCQGSSSQRATDRVKKRTNWTKQKVACCKIEYDDIERIFQLEMQQIKKSNLDMCVKTFY